METLVRRFFVFDHWLGAEPVGAGNINDTYRIDFEQNGQVCSWLLQRLNHQVFTNPNSVSANISAVAAHLEQRPDFSLRILKPQPGLNGEWLQRDEAGNYWRIFPFFPDTYVPEQLPTPAIAEKAARAYGQFLRALGDFPADSLSMTIPGFHDTDRRWAVFESTLAKDVVQRVREVRPEIEALRTAKPIFDAISRLKNGGALPRRVTHNDTKAGNVLFDERTHEAVAVIDWDTIMPGTVLSDFGDMVRTFATDRPEDDPALPTIRKAVLEALTQGFLSEMEDFLTPIERDHLGLGAPWIIGEQALRFLTDYLAGDVYYKTNYPEHNLVRARNQIALLKEVMA